MNTDLITSAEKLLGMSQEPILNEVLCDYLLEKHFGQIINLTFFDKDKKQLIPKNN